MNGRSFRLEKNMLEIKLDLLDESNNRQMKIFRKLKIYLRDQVNVMEGLLELQKSEDEFQNEFQALQEGAMSITEDSTEENMQVEAFQKYANAIQEGNNRVNAYRLKIMNLHASLLVKIFEGQFSADDFIDGADTNYPEICKSIYATILGEEDIAGSDEKKSQ